jgi:hypothetical protein
LPGIGQLGRPIARISAQAVTAGNAHDANTLIDAITATGAQSIIPRVPVGPRRAPSIGASTRGATASSVSKRMTSMDTGGFQRATSPQRSRAAQADQRHHALERLRRRVGNVQY